MVCFQRLHTYVCHVKQSFLKSPLFQRSIRVVSSRLHLFSYFCWIAKTIAVERITVKVVIMLSSFLFCETPIIHLLSSFSSFRRASVSLPKNFLTFAVHYLTAFNTYCIFSILKLYFLLTMQSYADFQERQLIFGQIIRKIGDLLINIKNCVRTHMLSSIF